MNAPQGLPTQEEALAWMRDHWPDQCSPLHRAGKVCEEAGEVIGAVIKSGDGSGRKTYADIAQETAQLVICAMGLAEAVGFDLRAEIGAEWALCQTRVWDDKESGR